MGTEQRTVMSDLAYFGAIPRVSENVQHHVQAMTQPTFHFRNTTFFKDLFP